MKYLRNMNCFMRVRHHIIVFYIFILNFTAPTIGFHQIPPEGNGWLRPSGKIIIHRGQNVEIFCGINRETSATKNNNFTSENLEFRENGQLLDSQYVTNVNETTIRLFLSNKYESNNLYECFLTENKTKSSLPIVFQNTDIYALKREDTNYNVDNRKFSTPDSSDRFPVSIGSIRVQVGEKPKDVVNFRCILYHWSTLKCLWDLQNNTVETSYSIHYVPINSTKSENFAMSKNSELQNSTISNKPVKCPNDTDRMWNQCIWSPLTTPQYLNMDRELNVTIIGVNMLGHVEQSIIFNQLEHRKSEEVSDLHTQNVTSTSFNLLWSVNHVLDSSGYRTCEVQDCYSWDKTHKCSEWRTIPLTWDFISEHERNYLIRIFGKRPYTIYHLRIRTKLLQAPAFEDYWSDYTYIDVITRPLRATHIPETGVGVFEIVNPEYNHSSRLVRILWKPFVPSLDYGDFHYEVKFSCIDEKGTSDKQLYTNWQNFSAESAPTFELGPSGYHFVIRSANSEGGAPNTSFINVPAAKNAVKSCADFYTIRRYNLNKTCTFECIWKPPKEQLDIVNYTLFWCLYHIDLNRQRIMNTTKMHWTYLPANTTQYQILFDYNNYSNITSNTWTYDIGISVNTEHSSSGLNSFQSIAFSLSDDPLYIEYISRMKNKSMKQSSNSIQKNEEVPSKRVTYNAWMFSHNQFEKWMGKLHGTEP